MAQKRNTFEKPPEKKVTFMPEIPENTFIKLNSKYKKGIDAIDKGLNFKYLKSSFKNKRQLLKMY
jgi:hypothetical protein